MINRAIIIGFGEVGKAHFEVLKKAYPGKIFYKDMGPDIFDSDGNKAELKIAVDLMMIATQCNPSDMEPFYTMVGKYAKEFGPHIIDILTTTPCGSTEIMSDRLGGYFNKSTIRGMHPYLAKFLIDIPKHIGGPSADELKEYYEGAGMTCITHAKSRATELFHALNNFIYGVNIMAATECAHYCREFGIDYIEFLKYRESNNDGFVKAGYPSKVSPIITPAGTHIGGHCVVYSATTIPEKKRGALASLLANFNKKEGYPDKVN